MRLPKLDAAAVRNAFTVPGVEAIEVPRLPLEDTGYGDLVRRLLAAPRFMSDFSLVPSEEAFRRLCRRMLVEEGCGYQLSRLLADLDAIECFAHALCGTRVLVSVRNWFAPGDLVWHVDRSARDVAYRILWPLGRIAGMRVTPHDNLDPNVYAAFMRREHPILCRLDIETARTGLPLETLWRHRPVQLQTLIKGNYPFLRDPDRVDAVHPTSVSVHRIETPRMRGTYHRSAWGNREAPGLQIIVTVTSS